MSNHIDESRRRGPVNGAMDGPDAEHLKVLTEGMEVWNDWRKSNPEVEPNLSSADLFQANLEGADLSYSYLGRARLSSANLKGADLRGAYLGGSSLDNANLEAANLTRADFSEFNFMGYRQWFGANLRQANLSGTHSRGADFDGSLLFMTDFRTADLTQASFRNAYLHRANASGANLSDAVLERADLTEADLSASTLKGASLREAVLNSTNLRAADLRGTDLQRATLVETELTEANLSHSSVYGISAWNLKLVRTIQSDLLITSPGESAIYVDNIEVAQFLYLILNNERLREVLDSITTKVVLILGRFTTGRKRVLDAVREELRKYNYLPVLFDFEKPARRDLTETISTLAHMARFIIADLTDAKSIPQELQAIVPDLPSVPVQPMLVGSEREYAMFEHFRRYPWVLKPVLYDDEETLLAELRDRVILPAEAKVREQAV